MGGGEVPCRVEDWEGMFEPDELEELGRLSDRQAFVLGCFVVERGNVKAACERGRCSSKEWYSWCRNNRLFQRCRDLAWTMLSDMLQAEAIRRALSGKQDRQSARLLLELIRAYGDPRKWRPEVRHTHEGDVQQIHRIVFGVSGRESDDSDGGGELPSKEVKELPSF